MWGGNLSPGPMSSAAAAAATAAFTAQSWLGQIPAAPPGQLPSSSMWGLHGKEVKTEQQILVSIVLQAITVLTSSTVCHFLSFCFGSQVSVIFKRLVHFWCLQSSLKLFSVLRELSYASWRHKFGGFRGCLT